MGLTVVEARSVEERERIYRFRYETYVEEMGLRPADADHETRSLRDRCDPASACFALLDDGVLLGTLRTTQLDRVDDPRSYLVRYGLAPLGDRFGYGSIALAGRLMLHPAQRRSGAVYLLMSAATASGLERGARFFAGDCSPHLLALYEHLGFRGCAPSFYDESYGFKLPILWIVGDRVHLQRIGSPLLAMIGGLPQDDEAVDFFLQEYAAYASPKAAALLPDGELLDLLGDRIADDPLRATAFMRDLSREEASRLLARASVVQARAGTPVVREGETDGTLFVVASGIAEVREPRSGRVVALLGPGDPFGEVAFLTGKQRTAIVVAQTDCEMLVLPRVVLESMLARDSGLGAKVLLNLARILADRLTLTTALLGRG